MRVLRKKEERATRTCLPESARFGLACTGCGAGIIFIGRLAGLEHANLPWMKCTANALVLLGHHTTLVAWLKHPACQTDSLHLESWQPFMLLFILALILVAGCGTGMLDSRRSAIGPIPCPPFDRPANTARSLRLHRRSQQWATQTPRLRPHSRSLCFLFALNCSHLESASGLMRN